MGFWHDHTFVICAYKESPYLEECIHSLLQQSTGSKIIMVTSTPNEYIESIAKKHQIALYVNREDKGIAQDWNFGYTCASTPYVTIAHQDDIYYPQYLEEIRKRVRMGQQPLILFTDYHEVRNGSITKRNKLLTLKRIMLFPMRIRRMQSSIWMRRRILSLGNAISCPTVTYYKNNLSNPLFRVGMRCSLDWETWEALSRKKGDFMYIAKPLMAHRIHEGSETSAILEENLRVQEDYEMFCKFWPKPIAKILVRFYSNSEKSNALRGK
ncbi:MAG: glycosyltransferase family 2 protein [Lachnospiraceae bacterium]|jgi:glycosyltransferase involved in cell wall biosynthesis